jgi:hypothetical protein
MGEKICISSKDAYISLEDRQDHVFLVDLDNLYLDPRGQNKRSYIGWTVRELAGRVYAHLREEYPDTEWTVAGYRKA